MPSPAAADWRVRVASAGDATALAELRWAWRTTEQGEVPVMGRVEFMASFERWCGEHQATHTGFVAEAGGSAVGTAWLATIDRVPGPAVWRRLAGHLQSVYVLPAHRNAGIGAALVEAVLDEAVHRGLDYLVVHPSERSFPLYRRLGFRETGAVLEADLRHRRH
jgi:GNAT superfamily N-acetyltransferase